MQISNAIIVGAGIAGLSMAKALEKLDIEVLLLEKTQRFKSIGGGITLYPHGAKAIDCLGLLDQARSISHELVNYNLFSDNKLLLKDNLLQFKYQTGFSLFSFSRDQLVELFANSLKRDSVRLGVEVLEVGNEESRAWVRTSKNELLKADIVILADGINSKFFSDIVLNKVSAKKYCGYSFWGGFLTGADCIPVSDKSTMVTLGKDKLSFILTLPNKKQWWYLIAKISEESWIGADKIKLAKEVFSNWCKNTKHILSMTEDAFAFGLPCFQNKFVNKWHQGRVVGIGDSVHGMGPVAGQGANTAMLDALVLAKSLVSESNFSSALNKFSEARNDIISQLYIMEEKSAASKMHSDDDFVRERNQKLGSSKIINLLEPVMPVITAHKDVFDFFYEL